MTKKNLQMKEFVFDEHRFLFSFIIKKSIKNTFIQKKEEEEDRMSLVQTPL